MNITETMPPDHASQWQQSASSNLHRTPDTTHEREQSGQLVQPTVEEKASLYAQTLIPGFSRTPEPSAISQTPSVPPSEVSAGHGLPRCYQQFCLPFTGRLPSSMQHSEGFGKARIYSVLTTPDGATSMQDSEVSA
jgi:hypothetical protein